MLNMLFGLCLLCLGISGIITNWWGVVDFIVVMVPILLVVLGTLSVMAGLSRLAERRGLRR